MKRCKGFAVAIFGPCRASLGRKPLGVSVKSGSSNQPFITGGGILFGLGTLEVCGSWWLCRTVLSGGWSEDRGCLPVCMHNVVVLQRKEHVFAEQHILQPLATRLPVRYNLSHRSQITATLKMVYTAVCGLLANYRTWYSSTRISDRLTAVAPEADAHAGEASR